ncbi:hypothetical protein [Pseudomonas sp. Leaf127]|uniref:hypothetical protein n=1 Tax=Pseudomonas sp. Leaf127 TaxID=1736267 RepID=UPI0012E8C997|nr:hypothetical protein [Pseudomonas sp. Leaf127]
MNELFSYTILTLIAITIYQPARWAKFACSGRGFTKTRFWIWTAYNFYFMCFHMYFVEKSHIPFYGPMENYLLGWLSVAMICLHISAIPTEWKRRPGRSRKIFDPKIRKHKLTFDRYRLAQPRKSILSFWKRE